MHISGAASRFGQLDAVAKVSLLFFQVVWNLVLTGLVPCFYFFYEVKMFREHRSASEPVCTEKSQLSFQTHVTMVRSQPERARTGGAHLSLTLFKSSSPQCLRFDRSHTNRMLQH